jgi:hypothetical protein
MHSVLWACQAVGHSRIAPAVASDTLLLSQTVLLTSSGAVCQACQRPEWRPGAEGADDTLWHSCSCAHRVAALVHQTIGQQSAGL